MQNIENKTIAIDLDNTFNDFSGCFQQFMKNNNKHPVEIQDSYFIWNHYGLTEAEFKHYFELFVLNKEFTAIKTLPFAVETVNKLSKNNKIHIATARYYFFIEHLKHSVINQTINNLALNEVSYDYISFVKHKYFVKADIYVEDSPIEIQLLLENTSSNVIVIDQPYNHHLTHNRIHRVSGWKSIERNL